MKQHDLETPYFKTEDFQRVISARSGIILLNDSTFTFDESRSVTKAIRDNLNSYDQIAQSQDHCHKVMLKYID